MQNKFLNFLGIAKKSGNLVEGYNNCEEAVKRNKVSLCILSEECSENTKNKFHRYCLNKNVFIIEGISCEELGKTVGKDIINVLIVKDKAISQNLIKLWKENYNM